MHSRFVVRMATGLASHTFWGPETAKAHGGIQEPHTTRKKTSGGISWGLACLGMVPRFQRLLDTGDGSAFSNVIFCHIPLALDPHYHLCQNHSRLLGVMDLLLDIRANVEHNYG